MMCDERDGHGRAAGLRSAGPRLSGACLAGLAAMALGLQAGPARAQAAAGGAAEGSARLEEISVEGGGPGRPTGFGGAAGLPNPGPETALGPVDGYVATRSATATKTDTPLLRTPQSVSVVGADQIQAQKAQTLSEAVRYTPGIYANQFGPDTRLDWFLIRGFPATDTGLFRDGLQLFQTAFANFRIDPFGAERIEVLRGPAATLFGGSPVGGLVNFVSKRPLPVPFGYVEAGGGSFNQRYGAFDVGGPADAAGHWFYRLTGRLQNADAQVRFAPEDRYYLAPSFTYKPDAATTLTILTSFQRDDTGGAGQFLPYSGTVRPNASGFRIPRTLNASDPLIDGYTRDQANLGYQFERIVDDVWTVRQNFRFSFTEVRDRRYVGNGYADAAETELARYGFLTTPRAGLFTVDNQAEARFADGLFRHDLLLGLDYKRYSLSDTQGVTFPVPSLSILFPRYGQPSARPTPYRVVNQQLQQLGFYAQDQVALTDRLSLIAGVRQDLVTNDVQDRLAANAVAQDVDALTYRLGLVYALDEGLAPYVTYGTSFNPTPGVDANNRPFRPETGEQVEVGVKFQPVGSNTLVTLAAFDLVRANVLTPNPANIFTSLQIGAVRSRGAEASVVSNPLPGLNLVASFTAYDLRTIEGTVLDLGRTPVGVPETFASFWFDYTIPVGAWRGFGFGGGVNYVGPSFADVANTLTVSEYVTFDAVAHYEWDRWRAALNVRNVGDRRFVASCSSATACFYGTQRQIIASLAYRW